MSADGWRDDLDSIEWCATCNLVLPKNRKRACRVGSKNYCSTCYDMQDAISDNSFMKEAEKEYRQERHNQKKLKPGEDYLQ